MCRGVVFLLLQLISVWGVKCVAHTDIDTTALIPIDKRNIVGRLENGLTYYIRYNNWPENRACFYLVQKVGSLQEEDNQRGLAHFLEHMCFNGTQHFKGNDVDRFGRSLGLTKGDMNAYTSFEETVYNIDDVPTNVGTQKLDSCLLVLYDWAHALTLDSIEIEKERGIVHEEWRNGRDAISRIYERQLPILFPDSRYGNRLPIGLMDVVDNFNHQELKDYYEKWYNPSTQSVIVVGDIDVNHVENRIKELFGTIPANEITGEVQVEKVADHQGVIYSLDKDKELQDNSVFLLFKHKAYSSQDRKYIGYLRDNYKTNAAISMLNERYEDIALEDSCSFLSASASDDDYFMASTKAAFGLSALTKDGMQSKALTEMLFECRRAAIYGFNEDEYIRFQKEELSGYDDLLMKADKRTNVTLCSELYGNYLHGYEMSSAEDYVSIMKNIVQTTSLMEINQRMKDLLPEDNDNLVIGCWTIEKDSIIYPTREELHKSLLAGRERIVMPYNNGLKDAKILPTIPSKGKILKEEYCKSLDYSKLTLSNGAKVLIKHTNIENSQVLFKAYGDGGWTIYGPEDDTNIAMIGRVTFGNNGLSVSQCNKLLAGKRVNLSHGISQRMFTFTGSANPKDLSTLMELIHADFTNMSPDEKEFQKTIEETRLAIINSRLDPESAFSDSVYVTTKGHHPRYSLLTENALQNAKLERILNIIQEQTACPSNYTFIFVGNYDDKSIRPLIELYLASLPHRKEVKKGDFIKTWLQEDTYCHFWRKMDTPKAMVSMEWFTEDLPFSLENRMKSCMISELLNSIYEKTIREEESATYDCSADYYLFRGDGDECQIGFSADCSMEPEKSDSVLLLMKQLFFSFQDRVNSEMFMSAKEGMLKSYDELVSTKNGFWLDIIWQKEHKDIDLFTNRRKIIEDMTIEDVVSYLKRIQGNSHFCETLMIGEK